MRNIEMKKLLPDRVAPAPELAGPLDPPPAAPALVSVLWARRWTLGLTVLGCVVLAAVYLLTAPRVYRATATIYVQQNAPRVFSDNTSGQQPSDTFLQSQADVIQSTPVLARVLEEARFRELQTFAGVTGDPVAWLRRGKRLSVEVVKRSDVMGVSVESPYPGEAALLADGVVRAYVAEQAARAREVGREMIQVLRREKEHLLARRDQAQKQMLAAQRDGGVATFRDGKGNLVLNKLDALATALAAAELASIDLRAEQESIMDALDSPHAMKSFVEGLQFRGRDLGDREYDELRSQLVQYTAQLVATTGATGPNNARVRALQTTVDYLKTRIAEKERAIADAQLADVTTRLAAAEQKEGELRAALDTQKTRAADMSPAAARHARLEAEVLDLQRRGELLDNRIAELTVNSVEAGPSNVRVLQPALVPEKPVKPNKSLTLMAAVLAGGVLGIGFASLREWQDARLRAAEEIPALVGVPLIGIVPRINRRLAPVDRGQVVRLDSRSPVAEAYRSIRTSLDLGDGRSAKTILITSPGPGDGKSTTAGNLAIAFAQAGDRTLLLDCNLREPVQQMIFEGEGAAGMSTVMPGETKLRDSVVPTRVPNLYLLPCGPVPRAPAEMLASDRFKHLLRTLCKAFDRIVIDSPALEDATDGRILAAAADVTVLVLRVNQSMRRSASLAMLGLNEVGANVLGAVANDVPAVSTCRVESGPWQYAAPRGREERIATASLPWTGELAPFAGNENGNGNANGDAIGNGHGNGAAAGAGSGRFATDEITLAEPDWPAEKS